MKNNSATSFFFIAGLISAIYAEKLHSTANLNHKIPGYYFLLFSAVFLG